MSNDDYKDSRERRTYKRFPVRDKTITVLDMNGSGLGEVLELSMSGLSYRYLDLGRELPDTGKLSLFDNEDFCCLNLPLKRISDKSFSERPDEEKSRRSSVEFGTLSPSQAAQLEFFIMKYTENIE